MVIYYGGRDAESRDDGLPDKLDDMLGLNFRSGFNLHPLFKIVYADNQELPTTSGCGE